MSQCVAKGFGTEAGFGSRFVLGKFWLLQTFSYNDTHLVVSHHPRELWLFIYLFIYLNFFSNWSGTRGSEQKSHPGRRGVSSLGETGVMMAWDPHGANAVFWNVQENA